jgi:hypothetical protein
LFLFLSGEYNAETSPSSYYLGYEGVALSQSELDRIAARYREVTGFDGGGYGRRDVKQRSGSLLARLDWNIDNRNHLSLSYSYLDARAEEYGNSLASFTFVGSGYANYSTAHYLAAMLESRISDRLHNSLRIGYSRVGDGRTPDVADMPSVIIRNTGATGGVTTYIGTDRYAGTNALTQNVVTLTDDLILDRGAHSITMGMHHELYNIHNIYLANHYGTYTYNSVADFENDLAAVYEYNYTDPEVTGTTTWGPRFRAAELNLYVQDRWAVGRSLQLTYGLRATLPLIFNTPTPNEKFNSGDIALEHGVRIGDVPESQLLLSPRIGLSWRRDFERGRLTVEGGAGIFAGHVPFVWVVNNYSNTGVEQKGVRLTAPVQDGVVTETAAPFTPTPSPTTLSNTTFTLNAMNRKFRYPQNFKTNAMAGYETDAGRRASRRSTPRPSATPSSATSPWNERATRYMPYRNRATPLRPERCPRSDGRHRTTRRYTTSTTLRTDTPIHSRAASRRHSRSDSPCRLRTSSDTPIRCATCPPPRRRPTGRARTLST